MKTMYFKSTTDGNTLPNIELSQALDPGIIRYGVIIYKINNVPDQVDWREVKNIFNQTAIVSSDQFEFEFSDLGIGKVLMRKKTK